MMQIIEPTTVRARALIKATKDVIELEKKDLMFELYQRTSKRLCEWFWYTLEKTVPYRNTPLYILNVTDKHMTCAYLYGTDIVIESTKGQTYILNGAYYL